MTARLQPWQVVFRRGLAPLLLACDLTTLRSALYTDDERLIQCDVTQPTSTTWTSMWPVVAGCLLGYVGWRSRGLTTVGEVLDFFSTMLNDIDAELLTSGNFKHSVVASSELITWFDNTPRAEMVPLLLAEVELELRNRTAKPPRQAPTVAARAVLHGEEPAWPISWR